jgi:hypothetical protein
VRIKSLRLFGFIALAAGAVHGQTQPPTTGAQYWSTTAPTCGGYGYDTSGNVASIYNLYGPVNITNSSGAIIGYSCQVAGTFPWFAVGGMWGTSIRVAAPASGAIGVDYTFYDTNGNLLPLDNTSPNGAASGNEVNFALNANQPAEVHLLGAQGNGPNYGNSLNGSVYAEFFCPDAITCATLLPQLLYISSLSTKPWALSAPIAWDYPFSPFQPSGTSAQWSAEGIDDGGTNTVSLAIYNQSTTPTIFTVWVFDSTGRLAGQGTTSPIAGFNGVTGEGGTYGALLFQSGNTPGIIASAPPPGVFKILIDGGSNLSSATVLQFNGKSATSLQVASDSSPSTSSVAASSITTSAVGANTGSQRVFSAPKRVFRTLPR